MRKLSTKIPLMTLLSNTRLKPKSRLMLLRKFAKQKELNWHQSVVDFLPHGKLKKLPNRRRKRFNSD